MSKKIAEIEQDGVYFSLWQRNCGDYVVCIDGKKAHPIHAQNEETAEGYFEDYVRSMR